MYGRNVVAEIVSVASHKTPFYFLAHVAAQSMVPPRAIRSETSNTIYLTPETFVHVLFYTAFFLSFLLSLFIRLLKEKGCVWDL